jgi:hypothetical protein
MRVFITGLAVCGAIILGSLLLSGAQHIVASFLDMSPGQNGGSDQANAIALVAADTTASMPVKPAAPASSDDVTSKGADQSIAGESPPPPGTLLSQFQAWAAAQGEKDKEKRDDVASARANEDVIAPPAQAPKQTSRIIRKPPISGLKREETRPVILRQEAALRAQLKSPSPVKRSAQTTAQSAQTQVPLSLQAEPQWTLRSE